MSNKLLQSILMLIILFITIVLSKIEIDFDPYKELGVPKHATTKEIRKAHKKLALRYHPDRTKDDSTTAKMSRINEAFAVISDEKKRREYDRQSQSSGQGGFNIFRQQHSQNKDDGLGILLTSDNSFNLLRKLDDNKPWLIMAYQDWNHQSKVARTVFEEACSKIGGYAHCGKFNADRQRGLLNEFGVRRVPLFIVYYNDFEHNKQYSKLINWRQSETKWKTLVNSLHEVLLSSCVMIYDTKDSTSFFDNTKYFDKKNPNSFNTVKALIFSDSQARKKPHILLQYLANKFSKTMDFGYHFIDSNHRRKQAQSTKIVESIGLELEDLEPPEMYVFRSPIVLSNMIKLISNSEGRNTQDMKTDYTLEDIGIYRISLESDVSSMTQFVLQYSTPLIPKIDAENFIDFCYLGNDGKLDDSKLCFLFGVMDDSPQFLLDVLTFGQYLLAYIDETIPQFGWINCEEQSKFCHDTGLTPRSKSKFNLVSLWMTNSRLQQYGNVEFDTKNKQNGKIYEQFDLISKVSKWISNLEDDSGNSQLWKKNEKISFPIATRNWSEDMNTWILSPVLNVLGFGASAVGSGASAIGTLIGYVFQFGFIFVFMFILLPLLRNIS